MKEKEMRTIFFRGKRLDNGKWIYGYLMDKHFIKVPYDDLYLYEVDPKTVGQFTGLVDCKGNKIFEGDIVLVHNDLYDCGLPVIFKCGAFWLYDKTVINADYPNDENAGLDLLGSYDKDFLEVIWNVYDNPEMLEVE